MFLLFISGSWYLDIIQLHKVINLFLWFCKFVAPGLFPKYIIEWNHYYNKYQWYDWVSLEYAFWMFTFARVCSFAADYTFQFYTVFVAFA